MSDHNIIPTDAPSSSYSVDSNNAAGNTESFEVIGKLMESTIPDIQLSFLESIESPRDFLAYISASPAAYRVYRGYKKSLLVSLISKNLSYQAVQTGVRVYEFIKSNGLSLKDLAKHGAAVPHNFNRLSEEHLKALFHMCVFYDPLVQDFLQQPWMRNKLYLSSTDLQLNRLDSPNYVVSYIYDNIRRLEGLNDVPIHARLYSGLFSLELYFRSGVEHDIGNELEKLNWKWLCRGRHEQEIAELYGLPAPKARNDDISGDCGWEYRFGGSPSPDDDVMDRATPLQDRIWAEEDWLVDCSLLQVFINHLAKGYTDPQNNVIVFAEHTDCEVCGGISQSTHRRMAQVLYRCHDMVQDPWGLSDVGLPADEKLELAKRTVDYMDYMWDDFVYLISNAARPDSA